VEFKETGYEKKILDLIRKEKLDDNVILVSFLAECLAQVRALNTGIETGLIYTKLRNPVEAAQKLGAQYLVPLYRFIHSRDVEKAHKFNLKIIVWTINTKEEAREYIAKGVDRHRRRQTGYFSNTCKKVSRPPSQSPFFPFYCILHKGDTSEYREIFLEVFKNPCGCGPATMPAVAPRSPFCIPAFRSGPITPRRCSGHQPYE
jgi:hypothetical protein